MEVAMEKIEKIFFEWLDHEFDKLKKYKTTTKKTPKEEK